MLGTKLHQSLGRENVKSLRLSPKLEAGTCWNHQSIREENWKFTHCTYGMPCAQFHPENTNACGFALARGIKYTDVK